MIQNKITNNGQELIRFLPGNDNTDKLNANFNIAMDDDEVEFEEWMKVYMITLMKHMIKSEMI